MKQNMRYGQSKIGKGETMTPRRQSGFSLLEAMMASVLLAAATAGVLLPIVAAANAQTDAQRRVIASRLASDVVEWLVAQGYQDVLTLYPDPAQSYTYTFAPEDYSDSVYQDFTCRINVRTVSVQTNAEVLLVSVGAYYKDMMVVTVKTMLGKDRL
jgi:Tfp pilus assembly protein PilV